MADQELHHHLQLMHCLLEQQVHRLLPVSCLHPKEQVCTWKGFAWASGFRACGWVEGIVSKVCELSNARCCLSVYNKFSNSVSLHSERQLLDEEALSLELTMLRGYNLLPTHCERKGISGQEEQWLRLGLAGPVP